MYKKGDIVKIPRDTKLDEANVNGIKYEPESLKNACHEFIKEENQNVLIYNPNLYNSIRFYTEYNKIHLEDIIGKCIEITNDSVKIKISDSITENNLNLLNSIKFPIAMFRLTGIKVGPSITEIKKLIAIDIKEKSSSYQYSAEIFI